MEGNYLELLQIVLEDGEDRKDRTGVGTKAIFNAQLYFANVAQNFPLITTKKMPFKTILSELLWFLSGSTSELDLRRLLHGNTNKKTIWTDNFEAPSWQAYLSKEQKEQHYVGKIYGYQWRIGLGDQIQSLVTNLVERPYDRGHLLTAWNPKDFSDMCLRPCHTMAQFYVTNDARLHCHLYQRSCDMFLGVPFNIASYALLMLIMAQCTNTTAGDFHWTGGDVHIYNNHVEQVKTQLMRKPYSSPTVEILRKYESPFVRCSLNGEATVCCKYAMSDFQLKNYSHHDAIQGDMAV